MSELAMPMTLEEAEDLAARTLAAIDGYSAHPEYGGSEDVRAADRERVASDLAGLRRHRNQPAGMGNEWCRICEVPVVGGNTYVQTYPGEPCPDAARYAAGLRRTASLYGVTE